jgi:hypothetical protein
MIRVPGAGQIEQRGNGCFAQLDQCRDSLFGAGFIPADEITYQSL